MSSTYPPGQSESGSDQALRGGAAGYGADDDSNASGFSAMDRTAAQYAGGGQDVGGQSQYSGGGQDAGGQSQYAGGDSHLRSELATLKSELDTLLEHVATLSEVELRDAYDRIMQRFSSARYAAKDMATRAGRQFDQGVGATGDYVREKPLQAVGIAVCAGLLLGMLLDRR
jgi:ElaB/YqjD/DUF883 family membrane-anchored ribosome-binding protein